MLSRKALIVERDVASPVIKSCLDEIRKLFTDTVKLTLIVRDDAAEEDDNEAELIAGNDKIENVLRVVQWEVENTKK